MIRVSPAEFWNRYLIEVRALMPTYDGLTDPSWTTVAIGAAINACTNFGLLTCNELHLDVMGYERRQEGIYFDWDLRVAFEHENSNRNGTTNSVSSATLSPTSAFSSPAIQAAMSSLAICNRVLISWENGFRECPNRNGSSFSVHARLGLTPGRGKPLRSMNRDG
jgi:hypothetical protein